GQRTGRARHHPHDRAVARRNRPAVAARRIGREDRRTSGDLKEASSRKTVSTHPEEHMIVDTHLHLIDKSTLRYPWLAGVPALDRDFSQETYAREARRAGIEAALFMEVDVDAAYIEAELAYVETLARAPQSLLRGAIVSCRPEEAGFAAWLETVAANPFVKGFRRVLHVVPDDVSERPLFRANIKRLAGTGLTFDLCVLPSQMRQALALVDSAPDVRFVLD